MKNVAPANTREDLLKRQNESYFEGMKNLTELASPSSEEIEATKEFIANKVQANFEEQSEIENPSEYYKNKAKEMWRKTIEDFTDMSNKMKASYYHIIAEAYEKLGDEENAKKAWRTHADSCATERPSMNPIIIAEAFENAGNSTKAIQYYDKTIKSDNSSNLDKASAYEKLNMPEEAFENAGNSTKAIQYYDKTIKSDNSSNLDKASAYEKLNMPEEAQKIWENIAKECKKNGTKHKSVSDLCNAIIYLEKAKKTEDAQKMLTEVISWLKNPKDKEGTLSLDELVMDDRDYEALLDLYKRFNNCKELELELESVLTPYLSQAEKDTYFSESAKMSEALGDISTACKLWQKEVDKSLNPEKYFDDPMFHSIDYHCAAIAYDNLARLTEN